MALLQIGAGGVVGAAADLATVFVAAAFVAAALVAEAAALGEADAGGAKGSETTAARAATTPTAAARAGRGIIRLNGGMTRSPLTGSDSHVLLQSGVIQAGRLSRNGRDFHSSYRPDLLHLDGPYHEVRGCHDFRRLTEARAVTIPSLSTKSPCKGPVIQAN